MTKFLSIFSTLFVGIFLLIGCENSDVNTKSPEPGESTEDSTTEIDLFELTSNEEKAYNNFQSDFDLKHLKDLEPISVAKLFVQSEIDRKFDVQYALYTDREELIQWSKEEDEKIPESDRPTNEQIVKLYKNIEKGKFIETGNGEGYIEYYPSKDSDINSGFKMIKNEDGVWQVAFTPIQ